MALFSLVFFLLAPGLTALMFSLAILNQVTPYMLGLVMALFSLVYFPLVPGSTALLFSLAIHSGCS